MKYLILVLGVIVTSQAFAESYENNPCNCRPQRQVNNDYPSYPRFPQHRQYNDKYDSDSRQSYSERVSFACHAYSSSYENESFCNSAEVPPSIAFDCYYNTHGNYNERICMEHRIPRGVSEACSNSYDLNTETNCLLSRR